MATKAVGVDLDQLAKEDLGDPIVMWPLCAVLWKNFVSFLSMDHICKLSVPFRWSCLHLFIYPFVFGWTHGC